MAGRFKRIGLVAGAILTLCVTAAGLAVAETVHGESRELGIRFQVAGGNTWCSPRIHIALTSDNPDALRSDSIPFIQMIGRIRAVVQSQCPKIETIVFEDGKSPGSGFKAEMSRLTQWRRLIAFRPSSPLPFCPPAVSGQQCEKQAEAYVIATGLLRGSRFDDAEIVNTLDADSDDLIFRFGHVVGKLRIVTEAEYAGQYSTAAKLADAITNGIEEACGKDGGHDKPAHHDMGSNLARRDLHCRSPGQPDRQNAVLVWEAKGEFRVFSLLAEGNAAGEALRLAGDLARAIRAQR